MTNKFFGILGAVVAGLCVGVGCIYCLEKRQEKAVGGKLMRVNYRFSKDFDN